MKKTQINAITRIIKNNYFRSSLKGIFTDSDGRACACCDYMAVRLTTDRPKGIPDASGVDLSRFFNAPRGYDLALPTAEELRAIIKETKKPARPVYDFGEELPQVNARYLLDMLRIFPDAKAYRTAGNAKNKAVFFESAHGDGLLMPLYKE